MSNPVEFVIIMSMRYMNPALMGLAHNWAEENTPNEIPGSHRMRSFHIAPDRGMSIVWFKSQDDLDAAFPMIKQVMNDMAQKFEARADIQKGITSPELEWGIKQGIRCNWLKIELFFRLFTASKKNQKWCLTT